MKKNNVRINVESVVEILFKEHNEGIVVKMNNITFKYVCINIDKKSSDPLDYRIDVYREGKILETFAVFGYVMNTWELISEPWIYNFINDITDLVIDNLVDIADINYKIYKIEEQSK